MKILHIGPVDYTYRAAGPSNSIRGLVTAQAEIGLEVGLLCSIALPVGAEIESVPGVSVVEGPHRKHYNPWFISQNWVVRIVEGFSKNNKLVKKILVTEKQKSKFAKDVVFRSLRSNIHSLILPIRKPWSLIRYPRKHLNRRNE